MFTEFCYKDVAITDSLKATTTGVYQKLCTEKIFTYTWCYCMQQNTLRNNDKTELRNIIWLQIDLVQHQYITGFLYSSLWYINAALWGRPLRPRHYEFWTRPSENDHIHELKHPNIPNAVPVVVEKSITRAIEVFPTLSTDKVTLGSCSFTE